MATRLTSRCTDDCDGKSKKLILGKLKHLLRLPGCLFDASSWGDSSVLRALLKHNWGEALLAHVPSSLTLRNDRSQHDHTSSFWSAHGSHLLSSEANYPRFLGVFFFLFFLKLESSSFPSWLQQRPTKACGVEADPVRAQPLV